MPIPMQSARRGEYVVRILLRSTRRVNSLSIAIVSVPIVWVLIVSVPIGTVSVRYITRYRQLLPTIIRGHRFIIRVHYLII